MKYRRANRAWLGTTPEHWKLAPLSTHFDERSSPVSDEDYTPLSVTKGGVVPQLADVAKTSNGSARKLVRKGDFVINSRSDRKGSAGTSACDGSVSVVYSVLTPRPSLVPEFAHHLFRSTAFQEEFFRWGNGIVDDLWSTRYSAMKQIMTAVPPVAEQRAIADFLDRETAQIDTLIAKQQRLIDTLRERRKAVIRAGVTGIRYGGEITASGEWFGLLPEGWVASPISYDFSVVLGKMRNAGKAGNQDGILSPYLAAGSIQPQSLETSEPKQMVFTAEELQRYSLLKGDVVVVEGGAGYGRSFHLTQDLQGWGFQNHVARLRPSTGRVTGRFVDYCIKACLSTGYIEATNRTATLPSLSRDVLGSIRIPRPPLAVQEAISDDLDSQLLGIDTLIEKSERFIELSRERRSALITAAVTGQIRIDENGQRINDAEAA